MTADVVRTGFCAVTSPSPGSGTRPDARRASNAPVKSPVEAFASGEEAGPGRDAETGGGGAGATAGAEENDGNEGGGGAGAAPIVGIALVSPGSDEKERTPWGIRVFAASSIARRASPASVDLERCVGAGAGARRRKGRCRSGRDGGRGRDLEVGSRRAHRHARRLEARDRLAGGREGGRRDLLARGQEIHGEPGHEREDLDGGLVQAALLARQLVRADDAREPVSDHHGDEERACGRLSGEGAAERGGLVGGLGEHGALRLEQRRDERIVLAAEVERAHGLVASAGRVEADGLPPGEPVVAQDEKGHARGVRVHAREKAREDVDLRAGRLDRGERPAHDGPVGLRRARSDGGRGRGRRGDHVLEHQRHEVLGEKRLGVRRDLVREGGEKRLDVSPRVHERRLPRREVILEMRGERFDQAACRGGVDRHTSPDGAIAGAFGVVFAALYSDSATERGPEEAR